MEVRAIVVLCTLATLIGCGSEEASVPQSYDGVEFSSQTTLLRGYRLDDQHHGTKAYAIGLDGPICLALEESTYDTLFHPTYDALTFFEAEGRISARGSYGNLGECPYAFAVSRILQDRSPTEAERDVFVKLGNNAVVTPRGVLPGPAHDPIIRDQ